ncbi:MAG: OsmC family protein [Verrucomicrobiota bacterium]
MVEISVTYEGDFRCLSTHAPSGAVLSTDAPRDNLGKGEAFSPTDLAATSLAVCMLTTMAIVVQKKSLPVDLGGLTAKVRKHMTEAAPRRIARIEVEISLSEAPSHREVLTQAALNCPVSLSLHPEVEQAVTFVWTK